MNAPTTRAARAALVGCTLYLAGLAQAHASTIFLHDSLQAYVSAAGGVSVVDPFANDLGFAGNPPGADPTVVTLDSGIVSVGDNLSDIQCNGTSGGTFFGCVGIDDDSIKWNLPNHVFGIAFDYSFVAGGLVLDVIFPNGVVQSVDVPAQLGGAGSGFLGITSDMKFSMVRWTVPQPGIVQIFELDTAYLTVPEPATALLLGLGLAGVGLRWRSRVG